MAIILLRGGAAGRGSARGFLRIRVTSLLRRRRAAGAAAGGLRPLLLLLLLLLLVSFAFLLRLGDCSLDALAGGVVRLIFVDLGGVLLKVVSHLQKLKMSN